MAKFRVLFIFILVLGCVSSNPGLASGKPTVTGMKSIQSVPSYFIPNSLNTKTGKRMQQSDVMAFVQTEQGRILFTSSGAYFGMLSRQNLKKREGSLFDPKHTLKQLREDGPSKIVVMKVGLARQKNSPANMPKLMEKTGGKSGYYKRQN